jgi:aldose 1-epimerase
MTVTVSNPTAAELPYGFGIHPYFRLPFAPGGRPDDRGICRLINEAKNAEFLLDFDRGFRELVVYTLPDRGDVISHEPYTQTTDAINLQARGVAAGLRILGHGAQDAFVITMETRG